MQTPYVKSNYERIKEDDYKTIDKRCVEALLASWPPVSGKIIDCCAPSGSGIVNELVNNNINASGVADAFSQFECDWIVTNPPYVRPLVDNITEECLSKLQSGAVTGIAMLMRANWDFAQSRSHFFLRPWYVGQIRMRFRPWWSEERTSAPIHNFVWHIWQKHNEQHPIILYWP